MNIKKVIHRYYGFSFLTALSFYIAVLVPFYTGSGHLSLFQVQILQSFFMISSFVLEIPTGVIADRFGRKHSLTLGTIVSALAFILMGAFPSFWMIFFGTFLDALGLALISGAGEALLYDSLKENGQEGLSKKVFGKTYAFSTIGTIIAALSGGFAASHLGLNTPMILSAIPQIIAAVLVWSIREPTVSNKKFESLNYLKTATNGIGFFYHHKKLRSLAIDGILVYTAAYFTVWLYQPLLQNLGIAIVYFGFIRALLSGSQALISFNIGWVEKIFGSSKTFLKVTALLAGLSLLVTALFPNIYTVLTLILMSGLVVARFTYISTEMNKYIESSERATVLSSVSMFNKLILVALNPVVGFMADRSLSLTLFVVSILPIAVFFISPIKNRWFSENFQTAQSTTN